MKRIVSVGLALAIASCGGDDRPPVLESMPGGGTNTPNGGRGGAGTNAGGTAGQSGSGADAGVGGADEEPLGESGAGGDTSPPEADPRTPLVQIISPDAVPHPDEGKLVTGNEVKVLCEVARSAALDSRPVEPSTVRIELLSASGAPLAASAGAATPEPNRYSAIFPIALIAAGKVTFRCRAEDKSVPPLRGEHTLTTFLDHGPAIVATSPGAGTARALHHPIPFEFSVTPSALAAQDQGADIDSVSLEVNGVAIPGVAESSGIYSATVALNDTALFPQAPRDNVAVVIRATNKRSPQAVTRSESYSFKVDAEGPVIGITAPPATQDVIGKEVTLQFTVTDAVAGVDPESIQVSLNLETYPFEPAWLKNGVYSFTFDSAIVKKATSQFNVRITASDKVGNASVGATRIFYLDTQGPIVHLDPTPVREVVEASAAITHCSNVFDPLGSSPNDGMVVSSNQRLRAMVWDRTNGGNENTTYYAGVNPTSVKLYVQSNPAIPLLTDTDEDGVCDAVVKEIGGKPIPFLNLVALAPDGDEAFPTDEPDAAADPPGTGCTFRKPPPRKLCRQGTDLARVIKHNISGTEPVIYAVAPDVDGLECKGRAFDLATVLTVNEGWICLAAEARDRADNASVSPPLHICYDDGVAPPPACAVASTPMPSCADSCMPPTYVLPRFLTPTK